MSLKGSSCHERLMQSSSPESWEKPWRTLPERPMWRPWWWWVCTASGRSTQPSVRFGTQMSLSGHLPFAVQSSNHGHHWAPCGLEVFSPKDLMINSISSHPQWVNRYYHQYWAWLRDHFIQISLIEDRNIFLMQFL